MPLNGESIWFVINDYELTTSRFPYCSVSGLGKRSEDIGVFRPAFDTGYIEGEGAFDIGQLAIEEAARILGWRPQAEVDAELADLKHRLSVEFSARGVASKKIKRLEAQLAELTPDPEVSE